VGPQQCDEAECLWLNTHCERYSIEVSRMITPKCILDMNWPCSPGWSQWVSYYCHQDVQSNNITDGRKKNEILSLSHVRYLTLIPLWVMTIICFVLLSIPRTSLAFVQTTSTQNSYCRRRRSCRTLYRYGDYYVSSMSPTPAGGNQTYPPMLDLPLDLTLEEYFWRNLNAESAAQSLSQLNNNYTHDSIFSTDAIVDNIEIQNRIHHADQEAIQHIRCILDIFNSTDDEETQHHQHEVDPQRPNLSLARNVVSKTVEGIVRALYLRYQKKSGMFLHSQTLEELESLLWQSLELKISPTLTTLETLWTIQQDTLEFHRPNVDDYWSVDKMSRRQVGRSVKLLTQWSLLASKDPYTISPPPPEYILSTFRRAADIRMTMTYSLWSLYEDWVLPRRNYFSKDVFIAVLDILAVSSPATWKVRETGILQQLEAMGKAFTPTLLELESALETASATGSSQQATWLLQSLQDRISNRHDDTSQRHLDLWYKAICNDNKDGSVLYLEQLLLPKSTSILFPLGSSKFSKRFQHRDYYNLYLQKLAKSGAPDAGMRAEAAYVKMETLSRESKDDTLRPNDDSLHAVVMAYMNAEAPTDVKLFDVQRFLNRRKLSIRDDLKT
jgi:hypothetical protein